MALLSTHSFPRHGSIICYGVCNTAEEYCAHSTLVYKLQIVNPVCSVVTRPPQPAQVAAPVQGRQVAPLVTAGQWPPIGQSLTTTTTTCFRITLHNASCSTSSEYQIAVTPPVNSSHSVHQRCVHCARLLAGDGCVRARCERGLVCSRGAQWRGGQQRGVMSGVTISVMMSRCHGMQ